MTTPLTLDDLVDEPVWLAWQTECREEGAKPTKVPYSISKGRGKADDPSTWGTHKEAERRAKQLPMIFQQGGVGVVLGIEVEGTILSGVDLDTCIDKNGDLADWARPIVDRFDSYTEISPSGTGLKIFFRYRKEDREKLQAAMGSAKHGRMFKRSASGDHPPAIELHLSNRFFTVTNEPFEDFPGELRLVSVKDLLWLLEEAGPAFVGNGHDKGHAHNRRPHDDSRSGKAFRLAKKLRRQRKTFDQIVDALRDNPDTADWVREKGEPNGQRELKRLWEKTASPADDKSAPMPLGYTKDGRFVLLDPQRNIIGAYTSSQLVAPSHLLALSSSEFWSKHFPAGERKAFDAWTAGEWLIEECREAGPFEMADIRGRGIWLDGDDIVINLGGEVPNPRYVCFNPIDIEQNAEFDTKRLLKLLELFYWRYRRDAYLALGWLAIAPICGVLSWRPHVWWYGPAKSGKTTLHGLLKACCSPLALSCDGGSTEAGIRQTLGADSLPVIMDEFEGDQSHTKGILKLARTASSADDPLLRGTPEGRALNFCLRTTFAFSSINPLGLSVADESRIVMLELTKHGNDSATAKQISDEIAYFRRQRGKWCSFMVTRAKIVPPAVEAFEAVINSGDRRHRQNMATLLAGAFVALHGTVPSEVDAEKWAKDFAPVIKRHAEAQERDDAQECLDYLFAHRLRGQDGAEYPLGHWVAIAYAEKGEGLGDARRIVAMHDMRIIWPEDDDDDHDDNSGMYLKNNSPVIGEIYSKSKWAEGGWMKALRKLDGARATKPMKFDLSKYGRAFRATMIPSEAIPEPIRSAVEEVKAASHHQDEALRSRRSRRDR